MLLMLIIMALPLLGLVVFWWLPLPAAIAVYVAALIVSGLYDWFMIRAMHVPPFHDVHRLIGASGTVLSWRGRQGRIRCEGEIWRARCEPEVEPKPGQPVEVVNAEDGWLEVKIV
jgi:membrane protein implicated in regulation of membrane protease activity